MRPLSLLAPCFAAAASFCILHGQVMCFAWPRNLRLRMASMLLNNFLSLPWRNDCCLDKKRGEPVGMPQEQPEMYTWPLGCPVLGGQSLHLCICLQLSQHMSSSSLGQLHHLLPMGEGAKILLLAGRVITQTGGRWLFLSTTWYLRCGWQDNDAPHSTDSPNSILTEHSYPWIYEGVYFQGVGTKQACGNSLSN